HWLHQVSVDSKGNIYTAEVDTGKRIQKFLRYGPTGCSGTGPATVRGPMKQVPNAFFRSRQRNHLLVKTGVSSVKEFHCTRWFRLMSAPPRGKVHMATDIAHYEDLND